MTSAPAISSVPSIQAKALAVAAVAAICLAGLFLRVACATGGLWLDEAWSAMFAYGSGTPAGVFLNINHDNNHYLNTLWLQVVGIDATPLLQRGLSIACGTATIALAAAIGLRRGTAAGLIVATLFALSPVLVTLQSEARGYAPMLLALIWAIAILDRWLLDPSTTTPATGMALATLLGLLSQATMLFGLAILGLWALLATWRSERWQASTLRLVRLFGPAALVAVVLVALAFWAAAASGDGFRFGSRDPHDWGRWASGLWTLARYASGFPYVTLAMVAAIATGLVRDRLAGLAAIGCLALPILVGLVALPNSGTARYYVVAIPPLLLATGIGIAGLGERHGRLLAWIGTTVLVAVAIPANLDLVRNQRGDPAAAIRYLERSAPRGAVVAVDHSRSSAILETAAATARYRLAVDERRCPTARWLFVERDGRHVAPPSVDRCGIRYRSVAGARTIGLSGSHWRLYRRLR